MKIENHGLINNGEVEKLLLYKRWPWHMLFWTGYVMFRLWPYYLTVKYFSRSYLEYMLFSEIIFIATTYFTLWLYQRLFHNRKYIIYCMAGACSWAIYLWGRTAFQLYYLRNEPGFKGSTFSDIFISNTAVVMTCFLFITACKYCKDGYIAAQFEVKNKEQRLTAEINNLRSQVAPHFLFNTLNNLYGLAVAKSDKLPGLMLRLSDLLRHSLYETQKPLVSLSDEIDVLKSYIELETIRLEDNLKLSFENGIPQNDRHQVVPLILIVFIENAFKHAKLVRTAAIDICIRTTIENDLLTLFIKNNYTRGEKEVASGIG